MVSVWGLIKLVVAFSVFVSLTIIKSPNYITFLLYSEVLWVIFYWLLVFAGYGESSSLTTTTPLLVFVMLAIELVIGWCAATLLVFIRK